MKSIAFKLWLGMMTLVSVVLLLLWLFQIVFLDQFYSGLRVAEIKDSGKEIIEELEQGRYEEFVNKLDEFAYRYNSTAEYVDSYKKTVYYTGAVEAGIQLPMIRRNARTEVYDQAVNGQTVLLTMTHSRFGGKFMLIGMPVHADETNGTGNGALLITLPMAPIEDTVGILRKQLVYMTAILIAVALIVSFLLARSFTKPIREITKVAMDMSGGNFSASARVKSQDEIGRLAGTINHMGQRLSTIDRLRKELIANVSHELRTPLSLIKGYAETIRDISGDHSDKRNRQLGIIIEESDRLGVMVEDILNLSQMQAGYVSLQMSSFRIDDLLNRVMKKFEIVSEQTHVDLQLVNSYRGRVEADETRIEQVIDNLVHNAFNHSPAGSAIMIALSEQDDKLLIRISDRGEGIPEEEMPYIWDRFYKANKSDAAGLSGGRKRSGTGLGLAIVKNILTSHQLGYGVESQVGQGTTFWFELIKSNLNKL